MSPAALEVTKSGRCRNVILRIVPCPTQVTGLNLHASNQSHSLFAMGAHMKARSVVMTIVVCLAGLCLSFAQNPQMGTWKLNEAKSKIPAGANKNTIVTYAEDGDNVKITTEGTAGDGSAMKTEWTGKFDGKDYPVTGDPSADTRSYKKVNDHTLALENKKGGAVTVSGRIVVSADGKSRTVNVTGKDAAGKKVTSKAVYEKQ